jgi:PAS domain S-box-containing protein
VLSQLNVTTIGQSFTDRDFIQQPITTLQPYLGVAIQSRATGLLVVPYGVPILNGQGKLQAILSVGIPLTILSDAIVNVDYGSNTRSIIIDNRNGGVVIAHSDPTRLLTPASGENAVINRLLAGESGAAEATGSNGEPNLVGFAPVTDLPWGVMVVTPSKTALAIIDTLTQTAILFIGFAILLAAIVGVVLMLGVTRPLLRLVEATREIGRGNLDYQVDITGKDEIGDLSREFGQMTHELKQTLVAHEEDEKALKASEEKYRTLVENLPVGVSLVTIDGRALERNKATIDMFGYSSPEESLRIPISTSYYDPKDRERFTDLTRKNGFVKDFEARRKRKDGTIFWVSMNAVPEPGDPENKLIIVTEDITERKQAEEALVRQARELEMANVELSAVNKELEAFSYSVSHDLRAPLRSIDGFSQILLDEYGEKFDGESKDYLMRVRQASQRMGILIDDVLGLSRVTRSEMHIVSVDLSALANLIVNELKNMQPNQQVDVVIGPGLTVEGDVNLLRIMLTNLLGNAWKFTGKHPQAKIEFGKTIRDGENVFFVRDDGAGFDKAYANKLFQPFQRLHGLNEFEGSGIGLATVQRVINRHGGKVWAEGTVEKGAVFYFMI